MGIRLFRKPKPSSPYHISCLKDGFILHKLGRLNLLYHTPSSIHIGVSTNRGTISLYVRRNHYSFLADICYTRFLFDHLGCSTYFFSYDKLK